MLSRSRQWAKPLLVRSYTATTRRQSHACVPLSFELQHSSTEERSGPLVILHGLFGSKQNWRTLQKTFARELGCRVYALDLRNHGSSPHSDTMDYKTMAEDVIEFLKSHNLKEDVTLMGHSMGGKVAMATALSPDLPPEILHRLIVVDMSPAVGPISNEFREYIDAMLKVEEEDVTSKKEADDILAEYEENLSIRQFLLTNLVIDKENGGRFRIPLKKIQASVDAIGDFPYAEGERQWEGKTLFIKGEYSKYLNRHNIPVAQKFFPNMKLEVLPTGHWVHAEKPREFVELVSRFVRDVPTKDEKTAESP